MTGLSGDHWAQLTYLVVLGLLLGIWVFRTQMPRPGRALQGLMAWALIFVVALGATALWQDIRGTVGPRQAVFADEGRVELPRSYDGHYYVTLQVNGAPIRFVVDTGATGVVLTQAAAARAGLQPEDLAFYDVARTANGEVRTAPVTLDTVTLGPFLDENLRAFVNGGEMDTSLLGMEYLTRFDRLEITGGRMVLER
jgi:aspartyl protease family protein